MSAELTIDTSGFIRAASQLVDHSSRTFEQFINGQALAVASRAIKHTEKANADKVAAELGQIATKQSVSKKGKVSFKRVYAKTLDGPQSTLAYRIVNALRRKQGLPMVWGAELDKEANKLRTSRLRAVGFIRSGWIAAIKRLSAAVGYRADDSDARRTRPQGPGYAIPANKTFIGEVSAEIGNMALVALSKLGRQTNPMPIAVRGLQLALDETERDMLQHLAEKLQPVFKQYSA